MITIMTILGAPMSSPAPIWTVADAKARLSELIEKARREGPQTITKNGRSTTVVVSIEEWERKTARSGSLAEFLLASPLRGADLDLDRTTDEAREIDL
jgi:prevent-host-death family protein